MIDLFIKHPPVPKMTFLQIPKEFDIGFSEVSFRYEKEIKQIISFLDAYKKDISFSVKDPSSVSFFHLHDDEEKILGEDWSRKRVNEFMLERCAANAALKRFFPSPPPVLKGENWEPLWPENITGSISHKEEIAIAVVCKKSQYRGLGIDIEERKQKIDFDISRFICTEEEIQEIYRLHERKKDVVFKLIFSIKEAIFKAFFHATGKLLGFEDIEITFEHGFHNPSAVLIKDIDTEFITGYRNNVQVTVTENDIVSLCIIPHRQGRHVS